MSTSATIVRVILAATAFLGVPLAASTPPDGRLSPTQRRCEYAEDPLGIDVPQPRLSWQVESRERGERQTAWQVLAATTAEGRAADRGDLWDSGRRESDETAHIPYGGAALSSSRRVFWKLRVWDRSGQPSGWSSPATWTMGMMAPDEWKGVWIGSPAATETLLLRRHFNGDGVGAVARRERRAGRRRGVGVAAGRHVPAPRGRPRRLPHRVGCVRVRIALVTSPGASSSARWGTARRSGRSGRRSPG